MNSKEILSLAVTAKEITKKEISVIRTLITEESFKLFPGSREQQAVYDNGDYQGWWPSASDRKFGQMVKASERDSSEWQKAVNTLLTAEAFQAICNKYGADDVKNRLEGWHESPAEIEVELSASAKAKAENEVDIKLGVAGSISDLAKLFPDHVKKHDWYREDEESSAWGTEYLPKTEVGKLAFAAVEAGERPVPAMEKAMAIVAERLQAEGKAKAEAEAIAKADRLETERLTKAENQAIAKLRTLGRERSPFTGYSSEDYKKSIEFYTENLQKIETLEHDSQRFNELRESYTIEINGILDKIKSNLVKVERIEAVLANAETVETAEIETVLGFRNLMKRANENYLNSVLATRKEREFERIEAEKKVQEKLSFSKGAFSALDSLKF